MKKLLPLLLCLLSLFVRGQFNPSIHVPINDAIGQTQSAPVEGRGMFWDAGNFKWRDFQSTAEVLFTLPTNPNRFSHFPIYIHSGGTLSGGVWTGGITQVWFFKDGLADGNLVRWYTDSVAVRVAQDSMWRLNDSTIAFTINGGPQRTVLVRGTAAGGISSLSLTAPFLFTSPVNFSNTGGAWSGNLTFANQGANVFLAGPATGGPGLPTMRAIVLADLPTGIPNGNLANPNISLGIGTSGTSPNWGASSVSLGGTATLNIPTVSGTNTGDVIPTQFNFWNAKVDSTTQSNDSVYEFRNGTRFFRYIIVGGGGGITSLNGLTGASQTFGTPGTTGTAPNWVSSGTVHTLNFPNASSSSVTLGGISNADYNTFTNKLSSTLASANVFIGNGSNVATAVAPSGDWTINSAGVNLVGGNKITYAKIQASTQQALLGATGAGNYQEITLGTNLSMTGSVLNATAGGGGVSSITNADGTLTITPTTGASVASLALGHANTWSALQTFGTLTTTGVTKFTGVTSGGVNDSVLTINAATGAVGYTSRNFNLFAVQGLSVYGTSGDSIGLGINPFFQPDTLKTAGFPFLITGLPNKATPLGTDSVLLSDVSGKLFKLPVPSGSGGTVTSVSGTANRITSTGGATPVIDISAAYVGQTSQTTLGTITTGVWNGTAIANANLANSSITINGTSVSLGGSIATNQVGQDSVQTITSGSSGTQTSGFNIVVINPASLLASYTLTTATAFHTSNDLYVLFGGTITSGNSVVTSFNMTAGSGLTFVQSINPNGMSYVAGEVIHYHKVGSLIYRIN